MAPRSCLQQASVLQAGEASLCQIPETPGPGWSRGVWGLIPLGFHGVLQHRCQQLSPLSWPCNSRQPGSTTKLSSFQPKCESAPTACKRPAQRAGKKKSRLQVFSLGKKQQWCQPPVESLMTSETGLSTRFWTLILQCLGLGCWLEKPVLSVAPWATEPMQELSSSKKRTNFLLPKAVWH